MSSWSTTFTNTKGKKLKAVDKGGLDSAAIADDKKKQWQPLLDLLKEKIADIKEARLTSRLKESAVCLVAEEGDMQRHMERLMQRMGRDRPTRADQAHPGSEPGPSVDSKPG